MDVDEIILSGETAVRAWQPDEHPVDTQDLMNGAASYLVQILLPKETGGGHPIPQSWFEGFLKELTEEFGGVTSFARAPAEGLWRSGGKTEGDNIAVIEVMAERLVPDYWGALRKRLEEELSQNEIVIRAQNIIPL